jgi:hypothetical protein
MSLPYLTPLQWRDRTVMPRGDADALDTGEPGYIASRIAFHQAKINARLAKRYAVPFAAPNETVLGWLTDLVTWDAYKKRGYNPSSEQDAEIRSDAELASAEIKEAADSETGLFDLPLRELSTGSSGVTQGGPYGYSESSPYTWQNQQMRALREEPQ